MKKITTKTILITSAIVLGAAATITGATYGIIWLIKNQNQMPPIIEPITYPSKPLVPIKETIKTKYEPSQEIKELFKEVDFNTVVKNTKNIYNLYNGLSFTLFSTISMLLGLQEASIETKTEVRLIEETFEIMHEFNWSFKFNTFFTPWEFNLNQRIFSGIILTPSKENKFEKYIQTFVLETTEKNTYPKVFKNDTLNKKELVSYFEALNFSFPETKLI
ncbi:MAG: hypothetical protein ACRC4M_02975 [Mycoplasma sp.]